jgi:MoxR-like ATPase
VRHTHHVSYHRCEPAADGHDAGEDAAAEALAIVERSMRNNQYYSAALKSSLARDVRALARPVMIHRMSLSFAARARGETLTGLIDRVTTRTLRLEAAA